MKRVMAWIIVSLWSAFCLTVAGYVLTQIVHGFLIGDSVVIEMTTYAGAVVGAWILIGAVCWAVVTVFRQGDE